MVDLVVKLCERGAGGSCGSNFMCAAAQRCIDRDLVNDGVDNCFDRSDEFVTGPGTWGMDGGGRQYFKSS